jgi:hypothetical protein
VLADVSAASVLASQLDLAVFIKGVATAAQLALRLSAVVFEAGFGDTSILVAFDSGCRYIGTFHLLPPRLDPALFSNYY